MAALLFARLWKSVLVHLLKFAAVHLLSVVSCQKKWRVSLYAVERPVPVACLCLVRVGLQFVSASARNYVSQSFVVVALERRYFDVKVEVETQMMRKWTVELQ